MHGNDVLLRGGVLLLVGATILSATVKGTSAASPGAESSRVHGAEADALDLARQVETRLEDLPPLVAAERVQPTRRVHDAGSSDRDDVAELTVVIRRAEDGQPLPVRAIVTGADGEHVDGSDYGLYADGRFFADGTFQVYVPHGETRLQLRSGPEHVPADLRINSRRGRRYQVEVELPRWFSPRRRGWYGSDHHVHAQHDRQAAIRTGLAYTVLQARANGLSYVTEAGSNVDYTDLDRLSTEDFIIHRADELRPGPFIGHLNTPGIETLIEQDLYQHWQRQPLPVQQIRQEVHRRGGAVIHTHPMTPPHQLHWMGAGELYSDAVLGRPADALDIDSRHTELLWFAALNLGNRIAASASTDAALGRVRTLSPGDRRVYCRVDQLTPGTIAGAIREGRTFATSGGPVFLFLDVEGHGPGETIEVEADGSYAASVEVQSLHGLRSVHLYQRGRRVAAFDVTGESGQTRRQVDVEISAGEPAWLVARAEDENGDWAITSPVYFQPADRPPRPPSEAMLLTIGNHTRFIELRRAFFAHMIVTVSTDQSLAEVALLRDGAVYRRFTPELGTQRHEGRTPVTEINGEYGPGWLWYGEGGEDSDAPYHFQADWPVSESGWYALRAETAEGRTLMSDAFHFSTENVNSHQLSLAHLRGGDTALTLHGYGEEMPLDQIELPFQGDHWWYPHNTHFHLQVRFGSDVQHIRGGRAAEGSFRPH